VRASASQAILLSFWGFVLLSAAVVAAFLWEQTKTFGSERCL
jgi:hypothetical protein